MSVGIRKNPGRTGKILRWMVVLLLVLIGGIAALWHYWTGWVPAREDYPVQGISVSAEQGEISWGAVRTQGVDFAYIRATTPSGERDQTFAANWQAAQEAGLRYGAELMFDPCRRAADQATLFITTVPRDNAALPPVIHVQSGGHCADNPGRDAILSELNTLLNLVETHGGKAALIRVSQKVDEQYEISSGINRTLWLERNYFPPDYAAHPWVIWTASNARRIEGIEGAVEWDVVAP